MLIMVLLIPITMILFGKSFLKEAPNNINYTFGYRTKMSMKNSDTWRFAHKYCGKLWYLSGLALLPFSVISMLIVLHGEADLVGTAGAIVIVLQMILIGASVILTERKLKRTFDDNGRKR